MTRIQLITTADGSHSLLNAELNETYHSVHGAIQESEHVFIKNGLSYWLEKPGRSDLRIFEIGFGTGLNVLLTMMETEKRGMQVYFESWETRPLEPAIAHALNYPDRLGATAWFRKIHDSAWNEPVALTPRFTLFKREADLLRDPMTQKDFDLVYYDAFAPSKQPDMWTQEVLQKVAAVMSSESVLVTYCAKGQVKRDLASIGMKVETLQGPPGKKEMVRAGKG